MSSLTSFGFGHFPFGYRPFGHDDWAYLILYNTLPEEYVEEDANNGYLYQKFVKAISNSFNEIKALIEKYNTLVDPDEIRTDLIKHLADSFGVEIDDYNPEAYQRMAIRIMARFNVIKGTKKSFEVLSHVYGFEIEIEEMWFSSTEGYTIDEPWISNEEIGTIS